jgi:hypothetical protein
MKISYKLERSIDRFFDTKLGTALLVLFLLVVGYNFIAGFLDSL